MTEMVASVNPGVASPEVIEERWLQSLALFELWTGIWADNPDIARRAGTRVEELMLPLEAVQKRYLAGW